MSRNVIRIELPDVTVTSKVRIGVKDPDGWRSFSTVAFGKVRGKLVAYVDIERLAWAIGDRAIRSKKGLTKLQGGAITVRVMGRTFIDPTPAEKQARAAAEADAAERARKAKP